MRRELPCELFAEPRRRAGDERCATVKEVHAAGVSSGGKRVTSGKKHAKRTPFGAHFSGYCSRTAAYFFAMTVLNLEDQQPFTTADGSTIRSILDRTNAPVEKQSLAEAR